ncbi:HAD-IB family phosphatase [Niabella aurantiaca]|uniref:HAD-IB family phosphatase n=1 Tax=Niabella aurantiaca TaxID=379900 RepID=UPI000477A7FF|nr:HAD-IB family phosphatase [Niabella aurantiaca]
MKQKKYYIIDFDSTFTQVEALDELARISLKDHPKKDAIYKEIEDLTNQAMSGTLSFSESLAQRVQLLAADKSHLKKLVSHLKKKVSRSFSRNAPFFKKNADDVLIVSGGFKEFITPVVKKFNIRKENIYANTFVFDAEGKIIGYDDQNPLSKEGGKVILIRDLNLQGDLYGIGDGYSDFQLRESGLIRKFFAYTENISRKSVTAKADHVTPSFDEFLYINKLPGAISYPKNRIQCLVMGAIPEQDLHPFTQEGFTLVYEKDADEKAFQQAGMLVIGVGTAIDVKQLKKATRLKAIGIFGKAKTGVPLPLCTEMGIVVFGSASSNLQVAQRMIDFMNKGAINGSLNFPKLRLPAVKNTHRIIHIHKNVPGVMAQVNLLLAKHQININAQFLMTNKTAGYTIIDIDKNYDKQLLKELKKTEHTIKTRVLY